ncbi:unnamed protein product [Sphagnum jensenii]|uniref:Uncharacterized protein n=1 Tax=Sphagnum jensenii TaxID=128206 RepID=A0ABP0WJB3_9BRYO
MYLHSLSKSGSFTLHADKKNENKEVAVDDFLGVESAVKAIDHSMNLKDLYVAHVYLLMGVSFVQWSKKGLKILNPR